MADEVTIEDFTTGTINGDGVFDKFMQIMQKHMASEYDASRLRGAEYASVYLGALQGVMDQSLEFLLTKDKLSIELDILEEQLKTAVYNTAEAEARSLLVLKEVDKAQAEIDLLVSQTRVSDAEALRVAEATLLITQQIANAVQEEQRIAAEVCKLKAEFDVLVEQKAKVTADTGLVNQRTITEVAQTSAAGVDDDSIVGRQKELYKAQADGFARDAEQKVGKLLIDTWNVRRTTDEGVSANSTNRLDDATIGSMVLKMLEGVEAA